MAELSVPPWAIPGLPAPGVYAAGSALADLVFWILIGIAIIAAVVIIFYLAFFRPAYERQRQEALALVGSRRSGAYAQNDPYSRSASSYTYRGDMPDAVAAAMTGMRREPEPVLDVEAEADGQGRPAYQYSGSRQAQGPRRGAPLPQPRPSGRARAPSPLDDLLGATRGGLRDEDRELLREEEMAPEPETPGLHEDEEVTFEDEPEPVPAVHPPAPYGAARAGRPVWESVLEAPAGAEGGQAGEDEEIELIDEEPPAHAGPALSRSVADELLRDDIMKTVHKAPPARPPAPSGRPAAARAPSRAGGPAWSEGRPVFSRPLEEPDVPDARDAPPAGGPEAALGDISHRLRSMDGKAGPRLPPKAEAKMGPQEKKFLEALRAVQEKKREEARAQEEDSRRMLEAQMAELENRKREEEARRRSEARRREAERLQREQRRQQDMGRWEQARRETAERQEPPADARPNEQRARQEAARRENERRRREAQSRQQKPPPPDVDDVLARIGIK
jgi:hypothetical protein